MRKIIPFIVVSLASAAWAADTEVAKSDEEPPATEATEETASPEDDAEESNADEDAKLFAELEAAAAAAAKEEKERAAKAAAERTAAKGEKHETFTTVKGRVYNKVTIRAVDNLGVRIMHEAGTARIPFADCPIELQERFGFDPGAAKAQASAEKLRESERTRRAIARLRAESGKPSGTTKRKIPTTTARTKPKTTTPTTKPAPDTGTGDAPDLDLTDDSGEVLDIPTLERKIATLEAGIEKIKKVGDGYEAKAKKVEDRVFARNAGSTREPELDPKAMKEVKAWRDKADAEFDKVAKARRLISKHKKTIRKLERAK